MAKLEQEVRGLHEECTQEESRYHYLHCMMGMMKQQEQRVNDEMKSYTSQDMTARRKNFRFVFRVWSVLSPSLQNGGGGRGQIHLHCGTLDLLYL